MRSIESCQNDTFSGYQYLLGISEATWRTCAPFYPALWGLAISTIVLAELYTWAFRRFQPEPLLRLIEDDLLASMSVLDFNSACARRFGDLRARLFSSGVVVNPVDLMIAAVALTHDLVLVTHNTKHFEVVPSLQIDDWLI